MQVRGAWRIVLGSLLAIALCSFARAADAATAPFCDDRAATLLASPPTLQPPETLLRAPAAPPSFCDDEGAAATFAVAPGHRQHQPRTPQADAVLPVCAAPTAAPTADPIAWPTHAAPLTPGVHWRIERPPRG
jgi:hypothetical protein